MDDQVVDMLRDHLGRIEDTCMGIREDLKSHTEKDAEYWQKIDEQQGQISLIKWLGGSLSLSGLGAWLFTNFGKH